MKGQNESLLAPLPGAKGMATASFHLNSFFGSTPQQILTRNGSILRILVGCSTYSLLLSFCRVPSSLTSTYKHQMLLLLVISCLNNGISDSSVAPWNHVGWSDTNFHNQPLVRQHSCLYVLFFGNVRIAFQRCQGSFEAMKTLGPIQEKGEARSPSTGSTKIRWFSIEIKMLECPSQEKENCSAW